MTINNDDTLQNWLALNDVPGLNNQNKLKLIRTFATINHLFHATRDQLEALHLKPESIRAFQQPNWHKIEHSLTWHQSSSHQILHYASPEYPEQLKEIHNPPLILYIKGNKELLNTPQIAMIGSRRPTSAGNENAFHFARCFAENGLTITSGLAKGIDTQAHLGALAATSKTVAVLGSGVDTIYPQSNTKLANTIAEQGLLLSEYAPNTPPKTYHFPERNRIISGLSLGVVIVEATLKSGSLITAKYALEQNKEVFAIPSSIHNAMAKGCHKLIKEGAKLVEGYADVIEEIAFTPSKPPVTHLKIKEKPPVNATPCPLLNHIDYAPTSLDLILTRSKISLSIVSSLLIELELKGLISASPNGYQRL